MKEFERFSVLPGEKLYACHMYTGFIVPFGLCGFESDYGLPTVSTWDEMRHVLNM